MHNWGHVVYGILPHIPQHPYTPALTPSPISPDPPLTLADPQAFHASDGISILAATAAFLAETEPAAEHGSPERTCIEVHLPSQHTSP